MPRRKPRQPAPESDRLPDLLARQSCRFPAQWSEIPAAELEARHHAARVLREKGYGAVQLMGESTAGLFDQDP